MRGYKLPASLLFGAFVFIPPRRWVTTTTYASSRLRHRV